MPHAFLVEHYRPGITVDDFAAASRRVAAAALELAAAGRAVRLLHATLVPEDEAAYCVIEAQGIEDVEATYLAAGVEYERILPAVEPDAAWPVPSTNGG